MFARSYGTEDGSYRMRRWMKGTVAGILVLGLVGAAAAWYLLRGNDPAMAYRTAAVKRGNLLVSISAPARWSRKR